MLRLLEEVDSALDRIDRGAYGVCEVCQGTVDEEVISENPLARVCLECLTPKQQRALEYDLELAGEIEKGLLPHSDVAFAGWETCYHYQAAGVVSGDYCDLIPGVNGELHFVMADVSGKGVAAAMLSVEPASMCFVRWCRWAGPRNRYSSGPVDCFARVHCPRSTPRWCSARRRRTVIVKS